MMFARSIIPVLSLVLLVILLPITVPANQKETLSLAVYVDIALVGNNRDSSGLAQQSLARAVANYLNQFLFQTGKRATFTIGNSEAARDSLFQTVIDSGWTHVMHLRPTSRTIERLEILPGQNHRADYLSVKGLLGIRIDYRLFRADKTDPVEITSGTISTQSRRTWLNRKQILGDREAATYVRTTAEPVEFILGRVISNLIDSLQLGKGLPALPARAIPALLTVDSHIVISNHRHWENHARRILATASNSLTAQFGVGIQATDVLTMSLNRDGTESFRELYRLFRNRSIHAKDTLQIGLYSYPRAIDYFRGRDFDEIGLSHVGQKTILLTELPYPEDGDKTWTTFATGLALLHEIGHLFGAVHVSDRYSIMAHNLSWLGTDRFDLFNRQIIRAALGGGINFDNPDRYVAFVADLLERSSYSVVDYPAFFYSFLKASRNPKRLRAAVKHRSYLTAADGYGELIRGKHRKAAELFRKAIAADPGQASLYYYLAQSAPRNEGYQALLKAAEMGYWKAEIRLSMLRQEQKIIEP
jgi:hypothetical protein